MRVALLVSLVACARPTPKAETKWCVVAVRFAEPNDFRGCEDTREACDALPKLLADVSECRRVEKPWCHTGRSPYFDCYGTEPTCKASAAEITSLKPASWGPQATCVRAWPAEMVNR